MPNYGKIPREKIEKIKFLRGRGYSVPEIGRELEVSNTSVLRYVKGVQILPEYLSEWAGKRGGSKKIRLLKLKRAAEEAESLVGNLTDKEKLLIMCSLYWAEGNKKDFILTNTDPELIKVFVNSLRKVLNIENDNIKVSLRLYEDINKDKSLNFWSQIVGIPRDKFLSINVLPGKKKGKLEYGMCRVRVVKGGDLLKKVMGINQTIAKKFVEI